MNVEISVSTPDAAKKPRKFLLGYLPCTALVIVPAWTLALSNPSPGPAAAGGFILLLIWSVQVVFCNLLIFWLRWTRPARFVAKAALVTVLNVALFPSILFVRHQVTLFVMGQPDLARHLREHPHDACSLLQVQRVKRINDTTRTVQADVECGAGKARRSCEWYFEYRDAAAAWVNPHGPYCR